MCLIAVDDNSLLKTLADPPLVWKLVDPDDEEIYNEEPSASSPMSWFSRLFGKKVKPKEPVAEVSKPEELMDLDKSWHGIHFLLTQTADKGEWPLNFLLVGGKQVGDVDMGYSPGRVFLSPEVAEINAALANITPELLSANYDPVKMKKLDIYPEIWDDREDALPYCLEFFKDLRSFITRTTNNRSGILIYLS